MAHILEGPVTLDFSSKYTEGEDVFRRPELLLHPPIPPTLHRVNPRNLEGNTWWNEVRLATYAKNDYHCFACGVHQLDVKGGHCWLEAHECYDYDWDLREITFREVVALCPYCHKFIHFLGILRDKEFEEILAHGIEVLIEAGVALPEAQRSLAKVLYPKRFLFLAPPEKYNYRRKLVQLMNYKWILNYGGKRYDWTARSPRGSSTYK